SPSWPCGSAGPGPWSTSPAWPNSARSATTAARCAWGAAVRQRHVERTAGGDVPLLAQALPWVGHREIRSRGTVCGSLAHADPSAELPAVALCLGATLDVAGPDGRRRIAAEEFFT